MIRLANRHDWPWKSAANSTVKLYAADAVEQTLDLTFNMDNLIAVARRLNRVAVLIETENSP
ncbi:hypothetical protein DLM45_15330 [Hyphomicrobium methylovorum]|nr:hypothetical protein [Hyphomicrobium methylovorum]